MHTVSSFESPFVNLNAHIRISSYANVFVPLNHRRCDWHLSSVGDLLHFSGRELELELYSFILSGEAVF